jgi:guanine deaminase
VLSAHADGGLLVDARGAVVACGAYRDVARRPAPGGTLRVVDLSGCVILPAMVDCHIHYPQSLVVAAYGEELLDWLARYVFPEEARFADAHHAREQARLFFDELIAQGTGTALIFGPHFEEATAIAFDEARRRRFRAIIGMTLADRNVPAALATTPRAAGEASRRLIERFHGRDKCRFAVTPRFAPACTPRLLDACRRLLDDHPGVTLQTHVNECEREIRWCRDLFPDAPDYVGVYERAGLLGPRAVLAHDVHPRARELSVLAATDTRVSHCPDSNSFLGSGLFPLSAHVEHGVKVGLGTDVGAGTTFSMLSAMSAAYKVQMLRAAAGGRGRRGHGRSGGGAATKLSGARLLYLATLAGARVLGVEAECGSFLPGRQADFIVIDPRRDPLVGARAAACTSLPELLFVLAIAGDKRLIRDVYLDGRRATATAPRAPPRTRY